MYNCEMDLETHNTEQKPTRVLEAIDERGKNRTIKFFPTEDGGLSLEFSDASGHPPIYVSEKVGASLARPLQILIQDKPETIRSLVNLLREDASHAAVVLDALMRHCSRYTDQRAD